MGTNDRFEPPAECVDCGKPLFENGDTCFNGHGRHRECWELHSSREYVQDDNHCPGCFNIILGLEGALPPDA